MPTLATLRKAERAAKLYRKGLTQHQVADSLGVSEARVCQLMQLVDEPARKRKGGRPTAGGIPIERRRELVRQWWKRLTPEEIAAELGCSISTVTRDAHELRLGVAQPGRPRKNPDAPYGSAYRAVVDAARQELDNLEKWLTVKRAATILKVDPQTVRQYAHRGRLTFVALEDVPELAHLAVLPDRYIFRSSEVTRLRRQLLEEWRRKSGPPERLLTQYRKPVSGKWASRWNGADHGEKGAADGVKGASRGGEGGAPLKATSEQVARIWQLHHEGIKPYAIAADVFGDKRFHRRVRNALVAPVYRNPPS